MRSFIDTNVLVYADAGDVRAARGLLSIVNPFRD